MSKPLTLWIGNDNLLTIDALTDKAANQLVTNATVHVTLKDEAGNYVGTAADWPVSMSTSTPGEYRATLRYDLTVTPGRYMGTIHVVTDTGGVGEWECNIAAKVRRDGD